MSTSSKFGTVLFIVVGGCTLPQPMDSADAGEPRRSPEVMAASDAGSAFRPEEPSTTQDGGSLTANDTCTERCDAGVDENRDVLQSSDVESEPTPECDPLVRCDADGDVVAVATQWNGAGCRAVPGSHQVIERCEPVRMCTGGGRYEQAETTCAEHSDGPPTCELGDFEYVDACNDHARTCEGTELVTWGPTCDNATGCGLAESSRKDCADPDVFQPQCETQNGQAGRRIGTCSDSHNVGWCDSTWIPCPPLPAPACDGDVVVQFRACELASGQCNVPVEVEDCSMSVVEFPFSRDRSFVRITPPRPCVDGQCIEPTFWKSCDADGSNCGPDEPREITCCEGSPCEYITDPETSSDATTFEEACIENPN